MLPRAKFDTSLNSILVHPALWIFLHAESTASAKWFLCEKLAYLMRMKNIVSMQKLGRSSH